MQCRLVRVTALAATVGCGPLAEPARPSGNSDETSAATDSNVSATGPSTSGGSDWSSSDGSSSGERSDVCPGIAPETSVQGMGFDESYARYESQRDAVSGSYWYRVERGFDEWSTIPHCLYATTIVVEDGVLVRRHIELAGEMEAHPSLEPCERIDVTEDGATIGTDDFQYAAPAWTLDQLYEGCCALLSSGPREDYGFSFSTFENGLLQGCSLWPQSCDDSCGQGPEGYGGDVQLAEIGFGPPP